MAGESSATSTANIGGDVYNGAPTPAAPPSQTNWIVIALIVAAGLVAAVFFWRRK
jgi:hypothetical protein